MSGAYLINVTRPPFIPRICKLDSKPLSHLAASSLDEKQGFDENEKLDDVKGSTHQARATFSQTEVTQTLSDLLAYAKLWVTFPHAPKHGNALLQKAYLSQCRKTPASLKEAALIQPEVVLVKAESGEIDWPVTQVDSLFAQASSHFEHPIGKTWTAKQIEELLDLFPDAHRFLSNGWEKESSISVEKRESLSTLFNQYAQPLSQVELLLYKAFGVTLAQEKTSEFHPMSAFTNKEIKTLENLVQHFLTLVINIRQASQDLYQTPDIRTPRLIASLTLGLATVASLSFSIACFALHVVTVVPLVISLMITCCSCAGLVHAYWQDSEVEVQDHKWQRQIEALKGLNDQLEKLKVNEMMQRVTQQGEKIQTHDRELEKIDTQQQSQAQQIVDLKERLKISEEERQQERLQFSARLQALEAKFGDSETKTTLEAQKLANNAASKLESVTHCC